MLWENLSWRKAVTMVCVRCHRGWWGGPDDLCLNCGQTGELRGVVEIARLPR